VTAVIAEMLENLEHSTWHISEGQSYTLNSSWQNLTTRTRKLKFP
jgi:hypothetical protein